LAVSLTFFLPRAISALSKALPSAREIALGKNIFGESLVAVWYMPWAALGKAFARVHLGLCRVP